jgi:hypothetical protein
MGYERPHSLKGKSKIRLWSFYIEKHDRAYLSQFNAKPHEAPNTPAGLS